jgi:hypothetical protein
MHKNEWRLSEPNRVGVSLPSQDINRDIRGRRVGGVETVKFGFEDWKRVDFGKHFFYLSRISDNEQSPSTH